MPVLVKPRADDSGRQMQTEYDWPHGTIDLRVPRCAKPTMDTMLVPIMPDSRIMRRVPVPCCLDEGHEWGCIGARKPRRARESRSWRRDA